MPICLIWVWNILMYTFLVQNIVLHEIAKLRWNYPRVLTRIPPVSEGSAFLCVYHAVLSWPLPEPSPRGPATTPDDQLTLRNLLAAAGNLLATARNLLAAAENLLAAAENLTPPRDLPQSPEICKMSSNGYVPTHKQTGSAGCQPRCWSPQGREADFIAWR